MKKLNMERGHMKDIQIYLRNVFHSKSGYIAVQFEFKSTKVNLLDLIELANKIDCNLWRYKPKRQILTPELVNNRYKTSKPRAKKQSQLKPLTNWIFFKGSLDKFQVINRLEFKKINSTYAKINDGISNNSIIALEIEKDKVFIIGAGIKFLYRPNRFYIKKVIDEVKQKEKYQSRISKLFEEVKFKDTADVSSVEELEILARKFLQECIDNKQEISIAKFNRFLFGN